MRYGFERHPYVPVGQKRANASRFADKLAKKQNRVRQPVEIQGRKIARSFWGKAWCNHLESLSDYANRLPRGATYVRNGSVVDLVIQPGKIDAVVAGSEPYQITISIDKLKKKTWDNIKKDCSSAIDSLIDLLGGRLSDGVMQRLTDKKSGCFPSARQIEMDCSCPDWSICCKHIAAVMYSIGSRLDSEPELLFLLRGVNQAELISQAISKENLDSELTAGSSEIDNEDLGSIFGIEMDSLPSVETSTKPSKSKSSTLKARPRRKAAAKKKPATKKTATKKTAKRKPKTVASIKKTTKRKSATKAASTKKKAKVKKMTRAKKAARTKGSTKRTVNQTAVKKKAVNSAGNAKQTRPKQKKNSTGKSTI